MAQTEVMPAVEQQRIGKPSDPCTMVIFGASRRLDPPQADPRALQSGEKRSAVAGIRRDRRCRVRHCPTRISASKVSEDIKQFATDKVDPDIWEWFVRRIYYLSGDMDDKNLYLQLKDLLDKVDHDHSTHGNHLYYLATAADFFGPAVEQLAEVGLMQEDNQHWRRVIIEKPFGHDLESARSLNQQLLRGGQAKSRSTASTITWARKPSRTSWRSASPTESSSPSGTAATSITYRSQ